MDVDCIIKNKSSTPVDFRTDLATYLASGSNIAGPDINSCTDDSLDISEAINIDDYSSFNSSDSDDVKITSVQKENTTKKKYKCKTINIGSSSSDEEDDKKKIIVKKKIIDNKAIVIICSDDEDEIMEITPQHHHVNSVQDCVVVQKYVNIPCDSSNILETVGLVLKNIVDKLVTEDTTKKNLQQIETTPKEKKVIDNKTKIVQQQSHKISPEEEKVIDNKIKSLQQESHKIPPEQEKVIDNKTKTLQQQSHQIPPEQEKVKTNILQQESHKISPEEKVIDNKTRIISNNKHEIVDCQTIEDCVVQNILEKLINDVTTIIQGEHEVDVEPDWSSSDDSLPENKRKCATLQEEVEVIHTITKEASSEELLDIKEEDIVLAENVHLNQIGVINGVVEKNVIVQSNIDAPALDSESAFFLEDRALLGKVYETFGPVKVPYYIVNLSSKIDQSKLSKGTKVFFAPFNEEFSKYVFVGQLKKQKGSDASWRNDCEPPSDVLEYSDDEEEKRAWKKQQNPPKNINTKTCDAFKQTPQENQSNNNTKKSNDATEEFKQTPQENQSNNNTKKYGKFKQPRGSSDVTEKYGRSRHNQRKNNERVHSFNYNHTSNVPTPRFPSHHTRPSRFSSQHTRPSRFSYQHTRPPGFVSYFNQVQPVNSYNESQNQFNHTPRQSSSFSNINRPPRINLPQQNDLFNNVQRATTLLPIPSRPTTLLPTSSRPTTSYAIPLDKHLERFPIVNNQSLRTDFPSDNIPNRNIPQPLMNNVNVTGVQPPPFALHQNSMIRPAANIRPYSAMQHPQTHNRNFHDRSPASLGNSRNMDPQNNKHGNVVNLNGFRLRR